MSARREGRPPAAAAPTGRAAARRARPWSGPRPAQGRVDAAAAMASSPRARTRPPWPHARPRRPGRHPGELETSSGDGRGSGPRWRRRRAGAQDDGGAPPPEWRRRSRADATMSMSVSGAATRIARASSSARASGLPSISRRRRWRPDRRAGWTGARPGAMRPSAPRTASAYGRTSFAPRAARPLRPRARPYPRNG